MSPWAGESCVCIRPRKMTSTRPYGRIKEAAEVPLLTIRLAKIACVAALALYVALVAFNNLTDYWTNFAFVTQVLDMEDIRPASHIRWRAITWPLLHHA